MAAITSGTEAPTFANTVAAYDRGGQLLNKVAACLLLPDQRQAPMTRWRRLQMETGTEGVSIQRRDAAQCRHSFRGSRPYMTTGPLSS
ncbi:MAG: hypothetical protein MZV63_35105 [Marinilabiliales bacterium]|nr:hypothetical protein [Marinilabiliales bacterium]